MMNPEKSKLIAQISTGIYFLQGFSKLEDHF